MGCSASDTSKQTAERREKRMASKNGDEATITSDETTDTVDHNNATEALARKAILRGGTGSTTTTHASKVPPRSNGPSTTPPQESNHTTPSPLAGLTISPDSASFSSIKGSKGRVAMEPDVTYNDEGSQKSVMGDVEMGSQVGRSTSFNGSSDDIEDGDTSVSRSGSPTNLATMPPPATCIHSGGKRCRRIRAWIDATMAFHLYKIYLMSKKGVVARSSNNPVPVGNPLSSQGSSPTPFQVTHSNLSTSRQSLTIGAADAPTTYLPRHSSGSRLMSDLVVVECDNEIKEADLVSSSSVGSFVKQSQQQQQQHSGMPSTDQTPVNSSLRLLLQRRMENLQRQRMRHGMDDDEDEDDSEEEEED